jgi:hypothetical protein
MKGLALGSNHITFSTVYTKALTSRADRLRYVWQRLPHSHRDMVSDALHLITSDITDRVIRQFPESEPLLDQLVGILLSLPNGRRCCMCHETGEPEKHATRSVL